MSEVVTPYPLPPKTTLKEIEEEAMKQEYIMEAQIKKYYKSLEQGTPDKEAFSRAIRASKQANKQWVKVALFSKTF